MSDILRLTILGCGSSPGVPRITGDWGACDPDEPRNRRRRCSALVERIGAGGRTVVVIDCGPDFREQMLGAEVRHIDGIVLTHPHADHIHGLDDVRGFFLESRHRVPVFADQATHLRVLEAFRYCYETPAGSQYPPIVRHVPIAAGSIFTVDGAGGPIDILPFDQLHGSITSLGLRIGPLAYCADVSDFPPDAIATIDGAQTIVIDALQHRRHPSHFSLDQAVEWVQRLAIPNAILTHMHTPLDYRQTLASLPDGIVPGYDGLSIDLLLG